MVALNIDNGLKYTILNMDFPHFTINGRILHLKAKLLAIRLICLIKTSLICKILALCVNTSIYREVIAF